MHMKRWYATFHPILHLHFKVCFVAFGPFEEIALAFVVYKIRATMGHVVVPTGGGPLN